MKRIFDQEKMASLIREHGIQELFSFDITPHLHLLSFEAGEYICRQDVPLDYLYFITGGRSKVYVSLSNGKSLLLCFYEGLKILGDAELLSGAPASTNVQVIEATYGLGIPFEKVGSLLLKDNRFLQFACSALGDKLIRLSQNSSINLLYPLENRLASYILAVSGGTLVFRENLTEIAELLGTSYRHLLRTLQSLVNSGAIKKEGLSYRIENMTILKKLASDVYMN